VRGFACHPCYHERGALLPHLFTLASTGPAKAGHYRLAVRFLCHFPSSCPDRALPGALPCGVRTFLSAFAPFGCYGATSLWLVTPKSAGRRRSGSLPRESPLRGVPRPAGGSTPMVRHPTRRSSGSPKARRSVESRTQMINAHTETSAAHHMPTTRPESHTMNEFNLTDECQLTFNTSQRNLPTRHNIQ
jgi:hypothetical protein